MSKVHLHNFVPCHFAAVLDVHADGKVIFCSERVLVEGQIAVFKIGVAQSISEWIKRLAGKVAIRTSLHVVVAECRYLVDGFIER